MPTYVWEHKLTGEQLETFKPMSRMDELPDGIDADDVENWSRRMQLSNVTRASFLDGQRRDLDDAKEVAKLKVERAGTKHSARSAIDKEIKTVEQRSLD
jgi:hypothetical protein